MVLLFLYFVRIPIVCQNKHFGLEFRCFAFHILYNLGFFICQRDCVWQKREGLHYSLSLFFPLRKFAHFDPTEWRNTFGQNILVTYRFLQGMHILGKLLIPSCFKFVYAREIRPICPILLSREWETESRTNIERANCFGKNDGRA